MPYESTPWFPTLDSGNQMFQDGETCITYTYTDEVRLATRVVFWLRNNGFFKDPRFEGGAKSRWRETRAYLYILLYFHFTTGNGAL